MAPELVTGSLPSKKVFPHKEGKMTNKGFVRVAALVLLFVGLTAGAYAQITIGGGFALSNMEAETSGYSSLTYKGDAGFGLHAYLDCLLPISIPLSLGAEIGFDGSSFYETGTKDTVTAIPFLIRAAYHFDLYPQLDLYLMGKLGYVFGSWDGDVKKAAKEMGAAVDDPGGVGFGFDLGAAWYFTEKVGAFAELGFDRYALSTKVSFAGQNMTIDAPFNRIFTAGVSFKF
jgi:hypothetical protein